MIAPSLPSTSFIVVVRVPRPSLGPCSLAHLGLPVKLSRPSRTLSLDLSRPSPLLSAAAVATAAAVGCDDWPAAATFCRGASSAHRTRIASCALDQRACAGVGTIVGVVPREELTGNPELGHDLLEIDQDTGGPMMLLHKARALPEPRKEKVHSPEDVCAVLRRGAKSRSTGPTNLNAESSRSHAIVTFEFALPVGDSSSEVQS